MAAALRAPDAYFEAFLADYRARRDRLCAGLARRGLRGAPSPRAPTSRWPTSGPSATTTTWRFCRLLPERVGVAAIPVSAFYARQGRGPPPRPLRLLQDRRDPRRGHSGGSRALRS